jgi:tetratricopeptide (TPR) repeat protein
MTHTFPNAADAQALLEAGIAASQRNDSSQALALFAEAGAALPTWAVPHFLMGSEYASLGEWAKAEAELANAVLLDPALHIARYQLGLLQFSSGRAAAALVTWQPLTEMPADPGLAEFVKGFAALAQDAFEQARSLFEQGLHSPGVNPAVAGDIQKVLRDMPGGQAPNAAPATPEGEPHSHVLVANYDRFKLH